jgi:hypothetical protein
LSSINNNLSIQDQDVVLMINDERHEYEPIEDKQHPHELPLTQSGVGIFSQHLPGSSPQVPVLPPPPQSVSDKDGELPQTSHPSSEANQQKKSSM